MKTAKAAVMTSVGQPFAIKEYPLTPPPPGMAQLELIASGICGTDLHIHRGKIPVHTPAIIGHEFVGRVSALSEEDSRTYGIRPGDRVIVDIACPCGHCLLCREGDDANCVHMGVTNGGDPETPPHLFGGYAQVNYSPVKNLIKIPENLDPVMVCVFACAGPTALHAFRLAEQAGVHAEKAQVAVVQGLGPVGTFAVMHLAALGVPRVIAVTAGNNPQREELARKLGATEVLNLDRTPAQEIIAHIREGNDGLGADLVFEASGNPRAVPQGMQMLRNRGVYLVPGQYSNSGPVEIEPQMITFNALHIIGSSQYSVREVRDYLDFLEKNPQLHECIRSLAKEYPLEEVNLAIQDAGSGKNIKTMLV